MNTNSLAPFFNSISSKIKLVSQIDDLYSKKLAPKFNSHNFLTWNENKVSEIIAFLLDPNADHQQGDIYLQLFLKHFNIDFFYSDISQIEVKVEDTTLERRRVDIIISSRINDHLIGIENKIYPWTLDQNNQVKDYLHYLSTMSKNYCLFYLAPKSKSLSEQSAGESFRDQVENRRLILINYEDHFLDLLKQFSLHSENERVRCFISDFELRLRKEYLGINNITPNSMITDYIKETPENIKIAFSISKNLNEVKNQLKQDLKNQMIALANELGIDYDSEYNHFSIPQLRNTLIKFAYEQGGVIYGIVKTKQFHDRNPNMLDCNLLKEHLQTKFKTSSWWPLHFLKYSAIEVNEQFWIDILNGGFKEFMREFIVKVQSSPVAVLNQADLSV
jgi:hypothetical protein